VSVPRRAASAIWILVAAALVSPQRLAALQGAGVAATASYTGMAIVDSAATARAAWGRANTASRANDLAAARTAAAEAARAWPTQEAYVWGGAVLAAQAHDTAATLRALDAYANLGLGRDLRAHPATAPYTTLAQFSDVVRRHDDNRAPVAMGRPQTVIADTTFWPEGFDADPRTGRYYIGSVRHRTIAEVDARTGAVRELIPRDTADVGAILGVRVDPDRSALWATTSGIPQMEGYQPRDSAIAALLLVRLPDGVILGRWNLPPSPGGHVLGDLAVGPNGDVYVTDSSEPVFYRLRPRGDTLEALRNPLFRSLQGIAPTPDGRVAYVADYSHGLLRIDLATGAVSRLADAPNSTSLGCDGLNWDRGALICVQNGVQPARVMRFALGADGWRIEGAELLDRNSRIADEPTIGAVVRGEFVYVGTSQWNKYDDRGARVAGTRLAPVIVLRVPLPR
jgi:hypothetical protein